MQEQDRRKRTSWLHPVTGQKSPPNPGHLGAPEVCTSGSSTRSEHSPTFRGRQAQVRGLGCPGEGCSAEAGTAQPRMMAVTRGRAWCRPQHQDGLNKGAGVLHGSMILEVGTQILKLKSPKYGPHEAFCELASPSARSLQSLRPASSGSGEGPQCESPAPASPL